MLTFEYTVGGVTVDIGKYVDWSSVSITEQINVPSQLTFNAYNSDPGFTIPVQRAYVRIYSTRFNRSLFTGYVSSYPNVVFQGLRAPGVQLFRYEMICTSDEYLLNCKAVPFIPAFVDQTQGQILASLANILCPGFFDVSAVGSGDIEPYYQYDPSQSWCEVAKTFADGSRYRYKARDKKIWFQPYGDGPLGITYDESQKDSNFDPTSSGLSTQVLAVPTVNDITIIGAVEAGNNREDYFIGDGFTGNFPLRHKVFQGASTLLLSDDWTEDTFNTQQWNVADPGAQFNLGIGALNIISNFALPLGQSYIQMNNGLELAGGIDLEHGEFGFNDVSEGIIGGLYAQSLASELPASGNTCLGGFYISSPSGVMTSASGAAGVVMQPTWQGVPIGPPIVSEINHSYVLQTVVTAPKYVRYNRWYRSLGGNAYGGVETAITGDITFIVQDFDIAAATGFYYQPNISKVSVAAVNLPAFCVYAMINNQQLNLTVNYTTLALMPLGALSAYEGPSGLWQPTGLILPMLPPGSGGYIGPVAPWPSSASSTIWPPPLPRSATPHQEVMGNGFEMQAAQITQGNEVDTLAFYAQTLPAGGTPIRLQSYESQAAVARLQASGSIAEEAYIVGDDGIRAAIVSNLSPLPRTSEDCDNAAQAYLADRTAVFYNGTYNCSSYFFNNFSSDEQFYPTCGRYLFVNAPQRGVNKQWMLVTQLTIKILDAVGNSQKTLTEHPGNVGEVLQFSVGFGADLHLEKVLYNFVDIQPPNVLTPSDTAEPVNPLFGYQVDNAYQPDLSSIMVNPINDTSADVTVYDTLVAPIEIRLEDANWGQGATPDYVGTVDSATFTLIRRQYEQIWYMRFVNSANGTYSRRSKVVRIVYPVTPLQPTLISADSNFVQFDFNGDIRNVYGIEIRAAEFEGYDGDGNPIYGPLVPIVQKPVESYGDLNIDLTKTNNTAPFSPNRTISAYFFNHQWSYSEPTEVTIPAPTGTIGVGYRFAQSLNVISTLPTENVVGVGSVPRSDLTQQVWEIADNGAFGFSDILITQKVNAPGSLTVNVPSSGNLWVRMALYDYIGSGAWSPSIFVPSGDLIASDYLVGQGSVPPAVLANLGFGGGIFAYNSSIGVSGAILNLFSQSFNVWFPNQTVLTIPPASASYAQPLDATGYLEPSTDYGFFPAVKNPSTQHPFLVFNGPYASYTAGMMSTAALTGAYQDGSVPLSQGALVAVTCASGGPSASGAVIRANIINGGFANGDFVTFPLIITGDGTGAEGVATTDGSGTFITSAITAGGDGYSFANATVSSPGFAPTFLLDIGTPGSGGGG